MKDIGWLIDSTQHAVDQPKKAQVVKKRLLVEGRIRACTRCPLRSEDHPPVPISGPYLPSFVVIGEAPGQNEMKQGEPFVGKAGALFRALMHKAGIDPDDVAFMNTVCCWPITSGKTHPPNFQHQLACRQHFLDQLAGCYTKFILLVGATGLHAFRDDLHMSRVHGKVLIGSSNVIMGITHPAAALRSVEKEHIKKEILHDLMRWKQIVEAGDVDTIGRYVMSTCAVCGDTADEWDEDAVGFCTEHWEKGKLKRNKAKMKWKGSGGYGQEVLFDGK